MPFGNNNHDGDVLDLPDNLDDVETTEELHSLGIRGGQIDGEKILRRDNGFITKGDSQQYHSLMKSLISHIKTGDDLLDLIQEMKVANYIATKEADLVTAAIGENLEVPRNLQMIMIYVINRGAVNNNSVRNVITGLTHTSFSSQRTFAGWGKKRNGNNQSQVSQ